MSTANFLGEWIGELPKGCKLCMQGLKSVLFITGVCRDNCFYCPISSLKKGRDITYINEVMVRDVKDVLLEVDASGSAGVGITGGDPLTCVDRVAKVITELKDFFGSEFHIHLYTSGTLLNAVMMDRLVRAGLDELRIHVINRDSWKALRIAVDYPIDVGIENPVLPNSYSRLKYLVMKAAEIGVSFINLNELEVSESNRENLLLRGFRISNNGITVEGSEDTALRIIRWAKREGIKVSIHYCPARFKDAVQFRRRMELRGRRTRRPYEVLVDGIIKWAEIGEELPELITRNLCFIRGDSIVTHPSLARNLGVPHAIIEAYPTTPRRVLNTTYLIHE